MRAAAGVDVNEMRSPHRSDKDSTGATPHKEDDTPPPSLDLRRKVEDEGKSAESDGVLGEGEEKRQAGAVMRRVYWRWLRFGSTAPALLCLFLIGFIGSELLSIGAQVCIKLYHHVQNESQKCFL